MQNAKKLSRKTIGWLRFGRLNLLAQLVFFCALAHSALSLAAPAKEAAQEPLRSVAFYYGEAPAWSELQAFDLAVVEPDHVQGALPNLPLTRIAAYVSVGEIHASKVASLKMPASWLIGDNRAWGSRVIDQSRAEWPAFFVGRLITPLWEKGYRSFFLDTLDAFQLVAKTPEQRAAQEAGLVAVIRQIKQRYPAAQLIFNRGFEILDRTHAQATAVVAESLFESYDAASQRYRPVPEQDREWLRGQLKRVQSEYHLPAIVIDYLPAAQREQARQTARKIEAEGFIPWVTTGDLTTLGVGSIEVMPRKVLLVHGPLENEYALRQDDVVRLATMPLNYLGYTAGYADPRHLPEQPLAGRYAGVVIWLDGITEPEDVRRLAAWLVARVAEGVPVGILGRINPLLATPLSQTLGLEMRLAVNTDTGSPVEIIGQDAMMGLETRVAPQAVNFYPLSAKQGRPLLTLGQGKERQVAAAIMPWGGYVISPYVSVTLSNQTDIRWVMDPFAFFRAALRLPEMPVPDVTTDSGRRMLMVHMDGDGFVSRSELAGNPYAGEVVRDRVVKKYSLPMTISVIEAELSPQGLYPKLSSKLESVARDIFQAPNVEIASHSYSHPFNWRKAGGSEGGEDDEGGYTLPVPGYRFNLQREIEGSIRYIETRLAPPGKKVAMFFWTGNCIPGRDALEWTQKLGVLNMNGGDTTTTLSRKTLTQVEGLGVERGGLFQVFAPNQNENIYTNDWTGPFYGYERMIETFALTESPRRLKPMDIYFHTYLATKRAGMQSLDKVFQAALKQENTPVFASEYARKVLDFREVVIARTAAGWRVRGMKDLQTLRLPLAMGEPDLAVSTGIAGWRDQGTVRYVHVADPAGSADLALIPVASVRPPRLVSANARILSAQRAGNTLRWQLAGHTPLEFTLANAAACRVQVKGHTLAPVRREGTQIFYRLNDHVAQPLEAICQH